MSRVGREAFRRQFADWAGHNCANMDYLTREQVNGNIGEDDIDGCDNKGNSLNAQFSPSINFPLACPFVEYERLYHAISSIAK